MATISFPRLSLDGRGVGKTSFSLRERIFRPILERHRNVRLQGKSSPVFLLRRCSGTTNAPSKCNVTSASIWHHVAKCRNETPDQILELPDGGRVGVWFIRTQ